MLNYCPEISFKHPADREFFYNILSTIFPHEVEKLVHDAILKREKEKDIPDEIVIIPEFRDIFTNENSILGHKGKTIQKLREKH